MKKAILMLVLFAIVSTSFAGQFLVSNAPTKTGIKIQSYMAYNDGVILLLSKNLSKNPSNVTDLRRVFIPGGTSSTKNLIATAMTAFINQKDVGFYAKDGSYRTPFWGGSHTCYHVQHMWINN